MADGKRLQAFHVQCQGLYRNIAVVLQTFQDKITSFSKLFTVFFKFI